MILCLRVVHFTSRPQSALCGMMYFDTSSKLKRKRLDELARFCGEGPEERSGRVSSRVSGEDRAELAGRDKSSVESALLGVERGETRLLADALLVAPERGVAIKPSGTWCTILGP